MQNELNSVENVLDDHEDVEELEIVKHVDPVVYFSKLHDGMQNDQKWKDVEQLFLVKITKSSDDEDVPDITWNFFIESKDHGYCVQVKDSDVDYNGISFKDIPKINIDKYAFDKFAECPAAYTMPLFFGERISIADGNHLIIFNFLYLQEVIPENYQMILEAKARTEAAEAAEMAEKNEVK